MTGPLQIADQDRQTRADQAGAADVFGDRSRMSLLAIQANTLEGAMLSDPDRLDHEVHLLQYAPRLFSVFEFAAAIGAAGIIVVEIPIDFGRLERGTLVPRMAGLSTAFAFGGLAVLFVFLVVLVLAAGINDVAGGRFGRVLRVLFGSGQFCFELRNPLFQFLEILLQPSTSLTADRSFPCHNGEKL